MAGRQADSPFLHALSIWDQHVPNTAFKPVMTQLWMKTPAILEFACEKSGRLPDCDFDYLQKIRKSLHPDNPWATSRAKSILRDLSVDKKHCDQFLNVVQGQLAGVAAAHHLRLDQTDATDALAACFHHYHAAWNLYSRKVNEIVRLAARPNNNDRATAILDSFYQSLVTSSYKSPVTPMPDWCTRSNWLLVRRLLSFLFDDADVTAIGDKNCVHMLLVTGNAKDGFTGRTAPATTSLRQEGWPAAYLDPVKLDVTILDEEMLRSLRIAARISWPFLKERQALRISPEPGSKELLLLTGGSAGGLLTVSACASARRQRLNRDATASFTVEIDDPALLEDVDRDLSIDDVILGPVDDKTIEAKLCSKDFRNAKLKKVYLHHTQQSCGSNWDDWVPRVENVLKIRITPVGAEQNEVENEE